jgi:hypothetical protein
MRAQLAVVEVLERDAVAQAKHRPELVERERLDAGELELEQRQLALVQIDGRDCGARTRRSAARCSPPTRS